MGQIDTRISDMESRIRALEFQSNSRGVVISYFERFSWILVTTAIGLAAYFFRT